MTSSAGENSDVLRAAPVLRNECKDCFDPCACFHRCAFLTDAEEKQGLHAQELFLADLQQQELLGNVSHPYAVLVHGGDVHPMSCRSGGKKGEKCEIIEIFKSREAKGQITGYLF